MQFLKNVLNRGFATSGAGPNGLDEFFENPDALNGFLDGLKSLYIAMS